jgi:hypothetical protein
LKEKVKDSGKMDNTLIRITCHELESFYLGDLNAVDQGLGTTYTSRKQNNQKYCIPDQLTNAAEELSKITKKKYQKMQGSRAIAPHLKLAGSNKSQSFNILSEGINKIQS